MITVYDHELCRPISGRFLLRKLFVGKAMLVEEDSQFHFDINMP